MNIGLIDVDGHGFPNLALMNFSAYNKNIQSNMELKIHKDKYNYKTIELVSDTLPNGSVSGQMPLHSLREAFDELFRQLAWFNFDENTEEYKFVDEIYNSLFE